MGQQLKQLDEAQSINLLVDKKSNKTNSSEIYDDILTPKEVDKIEIKGGLERLIKLEKLRKIAGYVTLVLLILIPLANPILSFLPNQVEQSKYKSQYHSQPDYASVKLLQLEDEQSISGQKLLIKNSLLKEYFIVLLTISISAMVATYPIEFLIKAEMKEQYRYKVY